jgi:hypothetical protein
MAEYFKIFEFHTLEIIGGWFATVSLGLFVKLIITSVSKSIDKTISEDRGEEIYQDWDKLVDPKDSGGVWLGNLERTLFYILFLIGKPEGIAFWLTIKVASKWEIWQNIVNVPDDDIKDDDYEWLDLVTRRKWGSRVLQRFLIGTLVNVLIGFVGALLAWYLINMA